MSYGPRAKKEIILTVLKKAFLFTLFPAKESKKIRQPSIHSHQTILPVLVWSDWQVFPFCEKSWRLINKSYVKNVSQKFILQNFRVHRCIQKTFGEFIGWQIFLPIKYLDKVVRVPFESIFIRYANHIAVSLSVCKKSVPLLIIFPSLLRG